MGMRITTYNENSSNRKGCFLPLDVYNQAVESFVILTGDVVFYHSESDTVFLAKRKSDPKGNKPWFMGGRILAYNQHVEIDKALQEIVRNEIGFEIDLDRLRFFQPLQWIYPESNNFLLLHVYDMTDEEVNIFQTLTPNPKHFCEEFGIRQYTKEDVEKLEDDVFKQIMRKIFK